MINDLKGTGVALVTPFSKDLSIDFDSLKKMVKYVSENGVDYLVVMGTTAESPTLSWSEKLEILEKIFSFNKMKLPVVFGLGGNDTQETISKFDDIKGFDLSAILSVSPYYNRPTQEGIYRHFTKLAESCPFGIILYNVPSRTSSTIDEGTVLKLSNYSNIIGIKDATGNLNYASEIAAGKTSDFLLIAGDDSLTLPIVSVGGEGIISVLANYLPKEMSSLTKAALGGNFSEALYYHKLLNPFFNLSSKEGNPASIKAALSTIDLIQNYTRLPLVPGSDKIRNEFKAEYHKIKKGS